MSETLNRILKHWAECNSLKNAEIGQWDLPFDIEAFCREVDDMHEEIRRICFQGGGSDTIRFKVERILGEYKLK